MIIFIFFISVFSSANPCGNFFDYSCRQGGQGKNDGTGQVHEVSQLRERLQKFEDLSRQNFQDDILKYVTSDRGANVRNEILDALGCQDRNINDCANFLPALQQFTNYKFREVSTGAFLNQTTNVSLLSFSLFMTLDQDAGLQAITTSARNRLDTAIAPLKRQNLIKDKVFPDVKASMIRVLQRLPQSPGRDATIERVRTVGINMDYCSQRNSILEPNAYYQTSNHEFNFCFNLMFRTNSLFSIWMVMAHEIAHSIDPCIFTQQPGVFEDLMKCLSAPRSAGLLRSCETSGGHRVGQHGEGFCDWMAAEVIADLSSSHSTVAQLDNENFTNGMANAFPFCNEVGPLPQERVQNPWAHPTGTQRLNLLVAHPSIRQRMGCETGGQQTYCPIQGVPPDQLTPPSIEENGVVQ